LGRLHRIKTGLPPGPGITGIFILLLLFIALALLGINEHLLSRCLVCSREIKAKCAEEKGCYRNSYDTYRFSLINS
jgi:hypothetical protein